MNVTAYAPTSLVASEELTNEDLDRIFRAAFHDAIDVVVGEGPARVFDQVAFEIVPREPATQAHTDEVVRCFERFRRAMEPLGLETGQPTVEHSATEIAISWRFTRGNG